MYFYNEGKQPIRLNSQGHYNLCSNNALIQDELAKSGYSPPVACLVSPSRGEEHPVLCAEHDNPVF